MSYRIEQDEQVAAAVPRIARKQAKQAIRALRAHQQSRERLHEARTSVKKLRGLLRLVGPALGDRYRRENQRLGDLGDRLGPPLRRVRTRLTRRLRNVERRLDVSERLHRAEQAFRKTRKRAKRWVPAAGGWGAMADGLSDTYRWGRRAMATAYDRPKDVTFHEWRKATKYHGYHVRLLADIWPEEMGGRLEVLERLGDLLGEDHDLWVFAQTLSDEPDCFDNRRDRQVLLGLIEQRQQALRALARPLGRRLFAEPPSTFKRRLHQYWKVWRERGEVSAAVQDGPDRGA